MEGQRTDSADVASPRHPKLWRAIGSIMAVATCAAVIWMLFEWVITDPTTPLDYVTVLVWPLVVVTVVAWLRQPIRAKLADLLKVSGFGMDAESTDPGKELQNELGADVEALRPHQDDYVAAVEAVLRDGPEAPLLDDQQASEEPARGSAQLPPNTAATNTNSAVGSGPATDFEPGLTEKHISDLIGVLRVLGVADKQIQDAELELRSDKSDRTRREVVRLADAVIKNRIDLWNTRQRERQDLTQQSIESIIRKSASWGYELGKSGSPPTTPEIEWAEDGTWRITTDIPRKRAERPRTSPVDPDRLRHIKSLEDEIKARESRTPYAAAGFNPYLHELKSRLLAIDPGNPWGTG